MDWEQIEHQKRMFASAMSFDSRMYQEIIAWIERGDMDKEDFQRMIKRRPEVYKKFSFLLDSDIWK